VTERIIGAAARIAYDGGHFAQVAGHSERATRQGGGAGTVAKQLGIDLGTANVLVYVRGRGIVINEPSVVAISAKDGRVKAVGIEARNMLGREPRDTIEVIRPMRNGVIADYEVTQEMLRYFINKAVGRFSLIRPEVMISVPAGVTSVERRAVRDAALNAGARRAYLIAEPLAAAIGARIPIADPSGNMVIDIGGGTTEVAIISLNGIVVAKSVRIGGNHLDDAIAAYIKKKHNLRIGERTAEEIKIAIGSALPVEDDMVMDVRGRDEVTGLPRTIQVHANEVVEAIAEPLEAILTTVRAVLEETPPELASDIIDKGMVLTGGGALLRNLDRLLTEVTGVPCFVADDPLSCVAIGTGLALEYFDVIRDSLEEV
jgi:rod shape-determining protein MreB